MPRWERRSLIRSPTVERIDRPDSWSDRLLTGSSWPDEHDIKLTHSAISQAGHFAGPCLGAGRQQLPRLADSLRQSAQSHAWLPRPQTLPTGLRPDSSDQPVRSDLRLRRSYPVPDKRSSSAAIRLTCFRSDFRLNLFTEFDVGPSRDPDSSHRNPSLRSIARE